MPATRDDFKALGGGMQVYAKLKAAKKRIETRETRARHAEERKNGPYAGLTSFPTVDGVEQFVKYVDWCLGGGSPTLWSDLNAEYQRKIREPTEVTVQTRDDDDRKPVERFDPDASYERDLYEPEQSSTMSATIKYSQGDYPPQWYFVHENFDVSKPGDAAAAKALLDLKSVEFAITLKNQEMIADMFELTDRGTGDANPLPNMARIATMGPRKLNKLRVAGTKKLYEYETEGGTWKD